MYSDGGGDVDGGLDVEGARDVEGEDEVSGWEELRTSLLQESQRARGAEARVNVLVLVLVLLLLLLPVGNDLLGLELGLWLLSSSSVTSSIGRMVVDAKGSR